MKKSSGTKSGGGATSKNVVQKPVITGSPAQGMHPGGVSQLGEAVGNHITDRRGASNYRGDPWTDGKTPAGGAVPLGNAVATRVGKGGPGADRTVMRSGSQCQTGPTNPGQPAPGASKPIFPGFK
jgi:hypothetical protein